MKKHIKDISLKKYESMPIKLKRLKVNFTHI